jgi:hypothetical protein
LSLEGCAPSAPSQPNGNLSSFLHLLTHYFWKLDAGQPFCLFHAGASMEKPPILAKICGGDLS